MEEHLRCISCVVGFPVISNNVGSVQSFLAFFWNFLSPFFRFLSAILPPLRRVVFVGFFAGLHVTTKARL